MCLFEIASKSIKLETKNKNGDSLFTWYDEDENTLFLVLSDGIGSSPCDWKASQVAVEKTFQYWKEIEDPDEKSRLQKSISMANLDVLNETGTCGGMKSTLAVAVWFRSSGTILWCSVGDSRVYVLAGCEIQLQSKDNAKDIIMRGPDGKVLTEGGSIAIRAGLTTAIGTDHPEIVIESLPDTGIYGILLATDGLYTSSGEINRDFSEMINSGNPEEGILRMIRSFTYTQTDDMTLVVARLHRNSFDLSLPETKSDSTSLPGYIYQSGLLKEMKNEIAKRSDSGISELIKKCDEFSIELAAADYLGLMDLLVRKQYNNWELYNWAKKKYQQLLV